MESKKHGTDNIRISGFRANVEETIENAMNPADAYHDGAMLRLSENIAVKYEEMGDYYAAMHWYERNIRCIPEHLRKHNSELPSFMRPYPPALNNLGLAQKRAGLFQKALHNYNLAIQHGCGRGNLDKLQQELDMWKGTSGELTKRLDE